MILQCYIDDQTMARLSAASARIGLGVEELAEAAISETALRDALENGDPLIDAPKTRRLGEH